MTKVATNQKKTIQKKEKEKKLKTIEKRKKKITNIHAKLVRLRKDTQSRV